MREIRFLSIVAALILLPASSAMQDEIPNLIKQLGAEELAERDAAQRALEVLGGKAESALREAATSSKLEIAARATAILDVLRKKRDEKETAERIGRCQGFLGERRLIYRCDGKKVKTGTLKTEMKDGILLLDDTYEPEKGHGLPREKIVQRCRIAPLLHMISIEAKSSTGGVETAAIRDGQWTSSRKVRGGKSDAVVSRNALDRVVALLPPEKGCSITLDLLAFNGVCFHVWPGHRLACLGEEETEMNGTRLKAWKWELQDEREVASHQYWTREGKVLKCFIPQLRLEGIYETP